MERTERERESCDFNDETEDVSPLSVWNLGQEGSPFHFGHW